jgi:hypothetical protein
MQVINTRSAASSNTHVGRAPPGYNQKFMTHTLHFHDFSSLSTVRGEFVKSPEFMLLDNQWSVEMYPGGDKEEMYPGGDEEGSIYLQNMSNNAIDVEYGFSVKYGGGKQLVYQSTHHTFDPANSTGLSSWGVGVAKRSVLLSSLVDGTLIIEVRMKLTVPSDDSVPPPFIPDNPSACKMIQELFLNDKFTDIVFEVVGDDALPVTFSAHRVIVSSCSTVLADLCESHGGGTTPIQITGVSPDVFRLLLSYIYGIKISHEDMKTHAKEIIDASDKYGVTNLKLEAEAFFVQGITLTVENVMDHLLYAESKNLALLKEASVDYVVANKAEVTKELSFANAPGSLIKDLLVALIRNEKEDGTVGDIESELALMRVSELRKKAYNKGLDIDGTRDMLIVAIQESL